MPALLLLILWPVAELFVAIVVAHAIGVLPMILLLIAGWPLGAWALRSRGRAAWQRLGDAVAAGGAAVSGRPMRQVLNGAFVLLGGLLLIIPGFITDVLGLVLLLPPTRALVRAPLERDLRRRWLLSALRFTRGPGSNTRGPVSYDVDSTAVDVDQPRLRP